MSREEIIEYLNLGREELWKKPKYTLQDIHEGIPEEKRICYGITDKGDLICNVGYYRDIKQWNCAFVVSGRVYEAPVTENIVAYLYQ